MLELLSASHQVNHSWSHGRYGSGCNGLQPPLQPASGIGEAVAEFFRFLNRAVNSCVFRRLCAEESAVSLKVASFRTQIAFRFSP